MNDKKPREFFLHKDGTLEESHNSIRPFAPHIVLREVVEGEPTISKEKLPVDLSTIISGTVVEERDKYKLLCEELAEALDKITTTIVANDKGSYRGVSAADINAQAYNEMCEALAKYRKVVGEK